MSRDNSGHLRDDWTIKISLDRTRGPSKGHGAVARARPGVGGRWCVAA